MMKRYAIYYAPRGGAFADAAAAWLGHDAARDRAVEQPSIAGLDLTALTAEPRRYGFHGTLKPPFRLKGMEPEGLEAAVAELAATLAPVTAGALSVIRIGRFLALVPGAPVTGIAALAAHTVEAFEAFRSPLSAAEYARRRPQSLTERQRRLLDTYGYPYVMDEFRFHLTLAGPVAGEMTAIETAARDWFGPWLGEPFRIDDLCLFGEDETGQFHLLSRHALTG
jgi:putative phosphonate metabolism protein